MPSRPERSVSGKPACDEARLRLPLGGQRGIEVPLEAALAVPRRDAVAQEQQATAHGAAAADSKAAWPAARTASASAG